MIRRIVIGLVAALVVLTVLEVILPLGLADTKPWWHHTTGYFGIYGLLACAALVYVAKFAGKLGLQQPEPPPEAEAQAPLDPTDIARTGPGGGAP